MEKPKWENPEWKNSANAYENGDFIHIKTESGIKGYRLSDPKSPELLLSPHVSNEDLGFAIIDALKNSRELSLQEAAILDKEIIPNYNAWVQKLMQQFGYKTKNKLFKKMRHCDMECENGIITIYPWHHEKLEAWSGDFIKEEDYVRIPADSPLAEIGAALRLAFSRCTGMGA